MAKNNIRQLNNRSSKVVEVEKKTIYKRPYDYMIITLLIGLVCFGLIMVYSSSYYVAEIRGESQAYYLLKQIVSALLGFGAMTYLMRFDYHRFISWDYDPRLIKDYRKQQLYKKPYFWVLILSILSLILVFTPMGVSLNGSRRWINLGISIQPSEIVKIGLIIFYAGYMAENPRGLEKFWDGLIVPYILATGICCGIIFFMPNFSAIVCIVLICASMLISGGMKSKHIGILVFVGLLAGGFLLIQSPYRVDRLKALVNPDGNEGWQLKQSLYSIAAGGVFGRGLGNSLQKLLYLPYRESDFIFAIICEELGLVGAVLLLLAYGLLIWRGIRVAINAKDKMGFIIATGITSTLAIQVIVNVMVNIGLFPPTGVVLPFMSYGGSSVVIFLAMMGLLLNVSKNSAVSSVSKEKVIPFYIKNPKYDDENGRTGHKKSYKIEKNKRKKKYY